MAQLSCRVRDPGLSGEARESDAKMAQDVDAAAAKHAGLDGSKNGSPTQSKNGKGQGVHFLGEFRHKWMGSTG